MKPTLTVTWREWRSHMLTRLERELVTTGDIRLAELLEEMRGYPGGDQQGVENSLVVPLRLRASDGSQLSLFSTTTVFGTPREVTVSELAIEAFYPADKPTLDMLGTWGTT